MTDYTNTSPDAPEPWEQIRFRLGDRTGRTIFAQLGPEPDRRSAANGGDILVGVVDEGWGRSFIEALNADPRRALFHLPNEIRLRLAFAVRLRAAHTDPERLTDEHLAEGFQTVWAPAPPVPPGWQPAQNAHKTNDPTPPADIPLPPRPGRPARLPWVVFEQIIESNGEVREQPPEGFEPFAVIRDDDNRRRFYWRGHA